MDLSDNRGDQELSRYYHLFADLLIIFWEFHKIRISDGQIPLSYFDGKERLEQQLTDPNLVKLYAKGLELSFMIDWEIFSTETQLEDSYYDISDIPQLSEKAKTFLGKLTPRIQELYKEAQVVGKQVSTEDRDRENLRTVLSQAITAGTRFPSHLAAIFGNELKTSTVLKISKISIDATEQAAKELAGDHFTEPDESYSLLDPHTQLKNGRLQQLGLGRRLGCVTSIPPSTETITALEKAGVVVPTTMLTDYTKYIIKDFQVNVREVYRNAPEEEKDNVLPEERRVIDGSVYQELKKDILEYQFSGNPERR